MNDLTLQAKQRLLASSTYDSSSQPAQNQNVNTAGADSDSKLVIETELGDARRGRDAAKARGHEEAFTAYENLIAELERANAPVEASQTENLVANDTSDFENMSVSNPSDAPVIDHDAEAADNEILGGPKQQPCLIDADLDPADPFHEDALKLDTTASTEDPISDGMAFDMLIDGDAEDEEPMVQELTQNDGGVKPDPDQPLLMNDVSQGPPTI